ncbi:MAG: ATP synthase F0 subunit C [Bdellovibrionaceae bacterium]|nr:ATP synthase F0 subunit C [Pseudobdellovibrionaceae bacterium]
MKKAFVFALTTLASAAAFAQEAAAPAAHNPSAGLVAIGAGLAIGAAVLGGTLAQGKASSAALEGIARNPAAGDKLFTPLILSLALIESLVILAFLVAFIKIPAASFGF